MPAAGVFFIALLPGALSQAVTLTGISLIDNNGDSSNGAFVGKGRLVVTLTTSTSGVVAGPTTSTVCGPLDTVTALFLCNQLGYLSASRFGTVGELGIDENTDTPVAIRNLDCNGATSLEACQFEVLSPPDPECTHSEDAALECTLSVSGIAGIVSGIAGALGIFIIIPIIIICCCCCRRKR